MNKKQMHALASIEVPQVDGYKLTRFFLKSCGMKAKRIKRVMRTRK